MCLCLCIAPGSEERCILTRDTARPLPGLKVSRARMSSTQVGDMILGTLSWETDLLFVLFRYSELATVQGYPGWCLGITTQGPRQVGGYTLRPPPSTCRHMHTSSANTPQAQAIMGTQNNNTTTPLDFEIFQCFT